MPARSRKTQEMTRLQKCWTGWLVCLFVIIGVGQPIWAAQCRIVNITGDYQSIFFPNEPKTFSFRLVVFPSKQGKRHQSLTLAYEVFDFYKKRVCQGSQLARDPGNQKNWVRLTVRLPATHKVGWFRVHLTLRCNDPDESSPVLATRDLDMAVVPASRAGMTDRYFGISEQGGYSTSMPPFTQFALPAMHRLGATTFRFFTGWDVMQAGPGKPLDFGRTDRILAAATEAGIDVLPMLGGTPGFAVDMEIQGRFKRPTARIPRWRHWQNFVEQMVRRYKGRIHNWEIWNEANAIGFWTDGNAEAYAVFLRKTYDLIKKIDPQARIVLAGVSGVKTDWIRKVIRAGAGPAIEVMNVHTYRFREALPEFGSQKFAFGYGHQPLLEDLKQVRRLMALMPAPSSGCLRQLWVTEDGYNTLPGVKARLHQAVSLADQASLLVRVMALAKVQQVDRFYWWTLHSSFGGGFGLLGNQSTSFMPKPAFVSYAVLQRQMAGAQKVTLLETSEQDLYVCRVDFSDRSTCMVWTPGQPVTIRFRSLLPVTRTDLMGMETQLTPRNEVIETQVNDFPVYIQLDRNQLFELVQQIH